MLTKLKRLLTTLACGAAVAGAAVAAEPANSTDATPKPAIQLGAPFCDNMVLQREATVPVWGWSKPGTKVTVEFAGKKDTAKAGKDGKWVAELKNLKASFDPREMVITENPGKKVVIKNILVGEVWMASGQSNMQMTCGKTTCGRLNVKPVGEGKVNPVREFQVTSVASQLHPIEKATGAWSEGPGSAIAYAFAHKLYGELNVPIGILHCSWSSTQIEAWVPREGWATAKDDYSKKIHQRCLQTDPSTPEHKAAWSAFFKTLDDQIAESDAIIKKGGETKRISVAVPGNMKSNRDACWLYNGRMSPVVPFAIRGAIWNQGWHNRGGGLSYYNNLHSLIRGWRIVWDKPELPVYFHQFYCPDKTDKPSLNSTAEMRLATWMARDIPHAGMASQIDIGGAIHYRNKTVPGRRLALHALKNQYGKKVVADGPMFKSYKVEGNKVIVSFDEAEGGLVVADTAYNRAGSRAHKDATGFADPKVIENGEEKVKIFWLAGEDRVWHQATCKIEGSTVVVQSDAVKKPRGISYGSGGIGFQPCLYNNALLPMTPFIQYDNKMVTTKNWPGGKLAIAGDPPPAPVAADGKPTLEELVHTYRKMPLLSTQFRDDAVLQADKPVTIWGSTRLYGEHQNGDEEGDCKVHFQFGDIKKVIEVTPGLAEWQVTLPVFEAGSKPYTLKVGFSIDGKLVHERIATGIIFGDVWVVAAPKPDRRQKLTVPVVKPSGQIVRMIENQSKTDLFQRPNRFSICVSRTPRVRMENGKWKGRYASYWKDADGLAAAIGNTISAKSGRPTGIVFLQSNSPLSYWISRHSLRETPSLKDDARKIGCMYRDSPYYLDNARRYRAEWKTFWEKLIPEMIETRAVPDGSSWGVIPSFKPNIGGSQATLAYNRLVHSLTPMALSGILFVPGNAVIGEDQGATFGSELSALANCFKSGFAFGPGYLKPGFGEGKDDVLFIYGVPETSKAAKLTQPKGIKGKSSTFTITDWWDMTTAIDAVK